MAIQLESPVSTTSYHTALSSQMSPSVKSATSDEHLPLQPTYRSVIPLPDVIRTQCHVLIDVGLYSNALALLQDLFVPGAANPDFKSRPTYAPIPLHIEIASALLIHPRFTNQNIYTLDVDKGAKAITFLRNVLAILGPENANLKEAFSFDSSMDTRGTRRGHRRDFGSDSDSSEGDGYDHPKVWVANRGRTRRNAKDFWHMVGWAFNCSVKYPQRWKYWKVWLEYILDVLDRDWYDREEQDQDVCGVDALVGAGPVDGVNYRLCHESILVEYLSDVKGRSSGMKRVVRSVFADACEDSIKEFPEVWQNETKVRKPVMEEHRKKGFGDYDEEEEDLPPELFVSSEEDMAPSYEDPMLGGPDSIKLRSRVLVILSRMAAYFPQDFGSVEDVYDAIYANIKPIPIPAFQMFFAPSNTLPSSMFVTLTRLLFRRMLPANAPQPHTVLAHDGEGGITQAVIEFCFLPFPANTSSVADNAKVSILVESVFRFFIRTCFVFRTPSLNDAIETGVKAREKKAKPDRKKKKDRSALTEEDEDAWDHLEASGERLRSLGEWVDANSGEE